MKELKTRYATPGFAFDLTTVDPVDGREWDFNDPAKRLKARERLRQEKPLFLAVDYNGDGAIGKGEYALIGNCGVKSLKLKPNLQEAWSVHTNGSIKTVTTPD